ncbi:MAG: right-handed parallel beta-helix repeat-containing protein [Kiritimatiellae bacterium]|nr:right-handed parallel beta-helix repeat-containing protein [Kiritimatiellia bacterium]
MMPARALLASTCVCLLAAAARPPACDAQTFSTVATYNNAGIEVSFAAAPPGGTSVAMFITEAGSTNAYRECHPLSRISSTAFAGSAFGLADGASYWVRLQSAAFASNHTLTVTTRPDAFADATNRTWHVATTGNDANSGLSSNQAFRTLGHALSEAYAGDKILLYDGRYYEGDLSAPRSGTPDAPIVIRNATDAAPVLDGTDTDFAPNWAVYDAGAGVYRTATAREPTTAYINGGQFFHYTDLNDLRTNRWEQPGGYYVDGSYLYARFPGGIAPGTNVVTIPQFTTGLSILDQACIQVIGITFCYYGYGTYHRGIYIDDGDSNLVSQCRFHHNGIGVTFKRAADFNTVEHCWFTESPVSSWSWTAVKSGDIGYEAGGVSVYTSTDVNQGNVIRYNRFEDMFDASGMGSESLSGPTKHMDYHDNSVIGCADDAFEVDGAGSNNRIYNNTFKGFLTGVSVAPAAIGPTYIFRNVFGDWHSVDGYEGYPFKFNVTSPLTIDWVHIYHNTCYTEVAGQDGFLFKQYSAWTNVISRNNIYAGTDYALDNWSSENPVDFDYDNLYTTHGSRFVRWAGVSYGTVAAFYAGTGQEQHGQSYAPVFVDRAGGDYRLPADSPLIDKGVAIPGINDGYTGAAPDIGAFEIEGGPSAPQNLSLAPAP